MRLLVVIVNYRTADLTIECLQSLRGEAAAIAGAQLVVIDNGSNDASVARVEAAISSNRWDSWARLESLPSNVGFAAGNNAAIRPALESADPPQYVLLLNPDTLVRPRAIAALLEFMDAHPDVGIAGSRLEHPDGAAQRSAFRFPTVLSEFESAIRIAAVTRALADRIVAPPAPDKACRVDWVAGASMIVRKAVFDAIGLLDENYFMYFEEVDFCRRAGRAGWPCWYLPASRVVHLVGQSSGVTDVKQSHKRRPAYWFESRRRYFIMHHGRAKTFLADMLWTVGYALWCVRRAIFHKRDDDPAGLMADFLRYNFLPRRAQT